MDNNIKQGLYYGMSFEDYIKIPAVNNSVLKILNSQSPAHAWHYIQNGYPETKALAFGRAADCYILEPSLFAVKYIVGPDCRRNSNEWKDFEAKALADGYEEVLKPEDMEAIREIYNVISKAAAFRLIRDGHSQVVCVWTDAPTGLLCKARLDHYHPQVPIITDFKTTQSVKPEDFARDVFKYGYYQQGAFYVDGLKTVLGLPDDHDPCFAFFAVEKTPPYVCGAFELGAKSLEAGRLAYRKALAVYADCIATNEWPPYCDKITMLDMPNWALTAAGFGPEMTL